MRWVERLGDQPRGRPLASWLVRGALALSVVYHGAWNLSAAGEAWWISSSGLPAALRFAVGPAEVAAAVALLSGLLSRFAALGLCLIFLGAIPQHAAQGFSFKEGGYEPIIVYALLSLAVAFEPRRGVEPSPGENP